METGGTPWADVMTFVRRIFAGMDSAAIYLDPESAAPRTLNRGAAVADDEEVSLRVKVRTATCVILVLCFFTPPSASQTRLCAFWLQKVPCQFGEQCLFAHGAGFWFLTLLAAFSPCSCAGPTELDTDDSSAGDVTFQPPELCPWWTGASGADCPQGAL